MCVCVCWGVGGGRLSSSVPSFFTKSLFVCVEVLRPSQPNGVMSSAVVYLTTLLQGRLNPLSG